jgi:hypothetical protein
MAGRCVRKVTYIIGGLGFIYKDPKLGVCRALYLTAPRRKHERHSPKA